MKIRECRAHFGLLRLVCCSWPAARASLQRALLKPAEKAVLEELPAPVAEPTPSEGVEEAAEAPVPEAEEMPNVPTSPLAPAVVLRANELALRMLKELEPARENLVLAPITALFALEMTLPGARGETAKQLEKALGLKPAQGQLVAKELARLASAPGAGNKLQIANGLYTNEGHEHRAGLREGATRWLSRQSP